MHAHTIIPDKEFEKYVFSLKELFSPFYRIFNGFFLCNILTVVFLSIFAGFFSFLYLLSTFFLIIYFNCLYPLYLQGFFSFLYLLSIFFLFYVFCYLLHESTCCRSEPEPLAYYQVQPMTSLIQVYMTHSLRPSPPTR